MAKGLYTALFKKYAFVSFLFILMPLICIDFVTSTCNNVGPNKNENLTNTCDWSTWYNWNCSCCGANGSKQFQFRKRAICCEKDVHLPTCLANCNFSSHSDTQYASCNNTCSSSKACNEPLPVNITLTYLYSSTSPPPSNSTDTTSSTRTTNSVTSPNASSTESIATSSVHRATTLSTDNTTQASINSSLSSALTSTSPPVVRSETQSRASISAATVASTSSSPSTALTSNITNDTQSTTSSFLLTTETEPLGNVRTQAGTSGSGQVSVGIILGGVFGGLVGLLILASIIYFLKRKKPNTAIDPDNKDGAESLKEIVQGTTQ